MGRDVAMVNIALTHRLSYQHLPVVNDKGQLFPQFNFLLSPQKFADNFQINHSLTQCRTETSNKKFGAAIEH